MFIKSNKAVKTEHLIRLLNRKIVGWTNYYRHVVAKRTFTYVDYQIFFDVAGLDQSSAPEQVEPVEAEALLPTPRSARLGVLCLFLRSAGQCELPRLTSSRARCYCPTHKDTRGSKHSGMHYECYCRLCGNDFLMSSPRKWGPSRITTYCHHIQSWDRELKFN